MTDDEILTALQNLTAEINLLARAVDRLERASGVEWQPEHGLRQMDGVTNPFAREAEEASAPPEFARPLQRGERVPR